MPGTDSATDSALLTTPSRVPAAQRALMYPKTDSKWYVKDANGAEKLLSQEATMLAPVRASSTFANITQSGLITVDGVALNAGDRVLCRGQTGGTGNGIWIAGTGAWTRAPDANTAAKMPAGTQVYVLEGSTDKFKVFTQQNVSFATIDTDPNYWRVTTFVDTALGLQYPGPLATGQLFWDQSAKSLMGWDGTGWRFLNNRGNGTSTARPGFVGSEYVLYETDTKNAMIYNGSAWVPYGSVTVEDENATPIFVNQLDFQGAGVTVSQVQSGEAVVTIPGGGGGGGVGLPADFRSTTMRNTDFPVTTASQVAPFTVDNGGSGLGMDGSGRLVVGQTGNYHIEAAVTFVSYSASACHGYVALVHRRGGVLQSSRNVAQTSTASMYFTAAVEGEFTAVAGDTFEIAVSAGANSILGLPASQGQFIGHQLSGSGSTMGGTAAVVSAGFRGATPQSIPGANTTVNFNDTPSHNLGGVFTILNSIVTVAVAGTYQLEASVNYPGGVVTAGRFLTRIEGWTGADPGVGAATTLAEDDTYYSAGAYPTMTCISTAQLQTGHKLRVITYHTAGSAQNAGSAAFPNKFNVTGVAATVMGGSGTVGTAYYFKGSLGNTSVALSANANIAFPTRTDPANGWNATNNNWVCPQAGRYRVTAAVKNSGAANYASLRIHKNGASYAWSGNSVNAGYSSQMIVDVLDCVAGDTISVQVANAITTIADGAGIENTYLIIESLPPAMANAYYKFNQATSDLASTSTTAAVVPGLSISLPVASVSQQFSVSLSADVETASTIGQVECWVDGTAQGQVIVSNLNGRARMPAEWTLTGLSPGTHLVEIRAKLVSGGTVNIRSQSTMSITEIGASGGSAGTVRGGTFAGALSSAVPGPTAGFPVTGLSVGTALVSTSCTAWKGTGDGMEFQVYWDGVYQTSMSLSATSVANTWQTLPSAQFTVPVTTPGTHYLYIRAYNGNTDIGTRGSWGVTVLPDSAPGGGPVSTDTIWTTLPFAGGANQGTIQYRRVGGSVQMDVKNLGHSTNTLAAGTVLSAPLPVGFRPSIQAIRQGQSGGVIRGIYVDNTTGELKVDFGLSGGGTFWGGFSFAADDATSSTGIGISDTGWITPALLNSWVWYGAPYTAPGYRRINGVVYLRGLLAGGSTTSGNTIFTLPVGYRPSGTTHFANVSGSASGYGSINILSDGSVNFRGGANNYFSLDGVTFPADQ